MATLAGKTITGTADHDSIGVFAFVFSETGLFPKGSYSVLGLGGDDSLSGWTGNDTLLGGRGNDFYVVDSLGDLVWESLPGNAIARVSNSSAGGEANSYSGSPQLTPDAATWCSRALPTTWCPGIRTVPKISLCKTC